MTGTFIFCKLLFRYHKALKMGLITSDEVEELNNLAIHSMGKLNKNAASLVS